MPSKIPHSSNIIEDYQFLSAPFPFPQAPKMKEKKFEVEKIVGRKIVGGKFLCVPTPP
jgi:hypothetical protein